MTETKKINLALQGGGAHGAFTWGVLDRLLREEDIEIEGVSATSAGAMNAAILAIGLKIGGRSEARRRLKEFWRMVCQTHPLNQPPFTFWRGFSPFGGAGFGANAAYHPAFVLGDFITRTASPYQFNPFGFNPLRTALEGCVDVDLLHTDQAPKLYISATDVMSGRARVFYGDELDIDVLLASACIPYLFQAVEIDGRAYWDGGYTGNPPVWPLIYNSASADVLVVHIDPIVREDWPREARAIQNRLDEIAFNVNLMAEMRAIETITKLLDEAPELAKRYKRVLIHSVEDVETMTELNFATKITPEWGLLKRLRGAGRAAMDRWLESHKRDLGVRGTADLRSRYFGEGPRTRSIG